jgi:hypothetical protein
VLPKNSKKSVSESVNMKPLAVDTDWLKTVKEDAKITKKSHTLFLGVRG